MATCVFLSKLLPLVRISQASGSARTNVRVLSRTASRSQLHGVEGSTVLTGEEDRFGGVTVNLSDTALPEDISESAFSRLLQGMLPYNLVHVELDGKAKQRFYTTLINH